MPNRRPQMRLVTSASPEEAAAVVAALERFLRDHAPPLQEPRAGPSGWQRAARLEGARADGRWVGPAPWGDAHPWGGRSAS
jgi:hypothetical protein